MWTVPARQPATKQLLKALMSTICLCTATCPAYTHVRLWHQGAVSMCTMCSWVVSQAVDMANGNDPVWKSRSAVNVLVTAGQPACAFCMPPSPPRFYSFLLCCAGNDFRQLRTTASGQTVQPPPLTTDGPVQDQGYTALPLTSFQGKIADSAGRAQVLVVYHYYESLTTCEEDEEIQLIRSNFLSFLR